MQRTIGEFPPLSLKANRFLAKIGSTSCVGTLETRDLETRRKIALGPRLGRSVAGWSFTQTLLIWGFSALLVLSALAKFADLQGFAAVVTSYRVLPASMPASMSFVIGALLALFELSLGILLVGTYFCPLFKKIGLRWLLLPFQAVIVLHLLYLSWLGLAYLRGLEIPNCGCFGVYWPRPLTGYTLIEDGVLVLLSLFLYRTARASCQ